MNTQPQISADLKLIKAAHKRDGYLLDLYGTIDEDGYEVNDIAFAGTTISLYDLVEIKLLSDLTDWANDNLPAPVINRRAQNAWLYQAPALYPLAA